MKESEVDEWSSRDPVANAFHTFGHLNNVAVSGEVQLVREGSYADALSKSAHARASDMILLPWSPTGSLSEVTALGFTETSQSTFNNGSYNRFVTKVLDDAYCNAAVFVNNGFGALEKEDAARLSRVLTSVNL